MKFNFFGNQKTYGVNGEPTVPSRRGFLINSAKTLGAVAVVGVTGKFGFDIAIDPVMREKIFSTIGNYFDDGAMKEKIEAESKAFFEKYGVRLDLKSLEEVNDEAKKKNRPKLERLNIIQEMASSIYDKEISKNLRSDANNATEVLKVKQKMVKDITADYLAKNDLEGRHLGSSKALSNFEKMELIEHLKEIFALYPSEFIKSLQLKTINSGKEETLPDLKNPGQRVSWDLAGLAQGDQHANHTADKKERVLYLSYSSDETSKDLVRRQILLATVSHELLHIKDHKDSDDKIDRVGSDWEYFNQSLKGGNYVGDEYKKMLQHPKGFALSYGAYSPLEDRATIAEALWSSGSVLEQRCKTDQVLLAKVNAIKQEYLEADSRFNQEYWNMLKWGNLKEAKDHIKYQLQSRSIK